MKVRELIAKLQECNLDNEVVIDGIDGCGLGNVTSINDNVAVVLNAYLPDVGVRPHAFAAPDTPPENVIYATYLY